MKKYFHILHVLWGFLLAYLVKLFAMHFGVSEYSQVASSILGGMIIVVSIMIAFIKITE